MALEDNSLEGTNKICQNIFHLPEYDRFTVVGKFHYILLKLGHCANCS